jgi:hypothetical protein
VGHRPHRTWDTHDRVRDRAQMHGRLSRHGTVRQRRMLWVTAIPLTP